MSTLQNQNQNQNPLDVEGPNPQHLDPPTFDRTAVDIDGVVVIGRLPLVRDITGSPFFLQSPRPNIFELTSLYLDNNNNESYTNFYCYKVGMLKEYNLNLFTNLEPLQVRNVFVQFLIYAIEEGNVDIGIENQHLVLGVPNDENSFNTILSRLSGNTSQFTFSSFAVFQSFSNWVNTRLGDFYPSKRLLASIIKMGQKDQKIELRNLRYVNLDDVLHSCLHLGFEYASRENVFFALNANNYVASDTCKVYNPLGLVDLATVEVKDGNPRIEDFKPADMPFSQNLLAVKGYIPDLKNSRIKILRQYSSRGVITAHRCLGRNVHLVNSPYKAGAELAMQLARSFQAAIRAVQFQQHGQFRFEYIFQNFFQSNPPNRPLFLSLRPLQNSICEHLDAAIPALTTSLPLHHIPFALGVDQALAKILTGTPFDWPKILAAESYLAYVIDGGPTRANKNGLRAALGSTLVAAKHQARVQAQDHRLAPMVIPSTPDFSHVRYDTIRAGSLEQELQYHLKMSLDAAEKHLLLLRRFVYRPIEVDRENIRYEAEFWLKAVVSLTESQALDSNGRVTGNLRSDGKHIVQTMSIGFRDLARCLLFNRARQGLGGKGIVNAIIQSHLYDTDPNFSDNQKQHHLSDILGRHDVTRNIQAWPLCQPIYSQDTLRKYAAVSEDNTSFQFVLGTLHAFSPNSILPSTYSAANPPIGWHHVSDLLDAIPQEYSGQHNRYLRQSVRSATQKTNFACLWLLICFTRAERERMGDNKFNLKLDRTALVQAFSMLDRHLTIMRDFGLMDYNGTLGPQSYLLNFFYVPTNIRQLLKQFLLWFGKRDHDDPDDSDDGEMPLPAAAPAAEMEVDPPPPSPLPPPTPPPAPTPPLQLPDEDIDLDHLDLFADHPDQFVVVDDVVEPQQMPTPANTPPPHSPPDLGPPSPFLQEPQTPPPLPPQPVVPVPHWQNEPRVPHHFGRRTGTRIVGRFCRTRNVRDESKDPTLRPRLKYIDGHHRNPRTRGINALIRDIPPE